MGGAFARGLMTRKGSEMNASSRQDTHDSDVGSAGRGSSKAAADGGLLGIRRRVGASGSCQQQCGGVRPHFHIPPRMGY